MQASEICAPGIDQGLPLTLDRGIRLVALLQGGITVIPFLPQGLLSAGNHGFGSIDGSMVAAQQLQVPAALGDIIE
jgi:hypothetical protein